VIGDLGNERRRAIKGEENDGDTYDRDAERVARGAATARAILDGVEEADEEIFPDPMSEAIAEGWRSSAVKALQRQFAAYVEQTPVKSKAVHPSVRG
jgi:hypothetical protein